MVGSLDMAIDGGEDIDGTFVGTWLKNNVGADEGFDDETEVGADDTVLEGIEVG